MLAKCDFFLYNFLLCSCIIVSQCHETPPYTVTGPLLIILQLENLSKQIKHALESLFHIFLDKCAS